MHEGTAQHCTAQGTEATCRHRASKADCTFPHLCVPDVAAFGASRAQIEGNW